MLDKGQTLKVMSVKRRTLYVMSDERQTLLADIKIYHTRQVDDHRILISPSFDQYWNCSNLATMYHNTIVGYYVR